MARDDPPPASPSIAALTGAIRLRPGDAARPIDGARPMWAQRLGAGKRARDLPQVLAAVYNVCGMAHALAARLAIRAAQGRDAALTTQEVESLRTSTWREHVRRMLVDWPTLLPGAHDWREPMARALRHAPHGAMSGTVSPMTTSVEHDRRDARSWLQRTADGPRGLAAMIERVARGSGNAPGDRERADECGPTPAALPPMRALPVLSDPEVMMRTMARSMLDDEGFCSRPHWQGQAWETGAWCRARARQQVNPSALRGAVSLLTSRLDEALALCGDDGHGVLAHGGLVLGGREGIGWVEMARGLLVHAVRLEGDDGDARVATCRVLAPTEWNFHPDGVLAQAVGSLHGVHAASQARLLAASFDACVPVGVVAHHAVVAAHRERIDA